MSWMLFGLFHLHIVVSLFNPIFFYDRLKESLVKVYFLNKILQLLILFIFLSLPSYHFSFFFLYRFLHNFINLAVVLTRFMEFLFYLTNHKFVFAHICSYLRWSHIEEFFVAKITRLSLWHRALYHFFLLFEFDIDRRTQSFLALKIDRRCLSNCLWWAFIIAIIIYFINALPWHNWICLRSISNICSWFNVLESFQLSYCSLQCVSISYTISPVQFIFWKNKWTPFLTILVLITISIAISEKIIIYFWVSCCSILKLEIADDDFSFLYCYSSFSLSIYNYFS